MYLDGSCDISDILKFHKVRILVKGFGYSSYVKKFFFLKSKNSKFDIY